MASLRIGFIGAGNMAQALIKGFITAGISSPRDITVSSPKVDQFLLEQVASLGCNTTHDNRDAGAFHDVVILAVKPDVIPRVLHDLQPCVTPVQPLVASVALGITLDTMEAALPPGSRTMRIMPNTPALVQFGASVFCRGSNANEEDVQITKRMLSAVGEADEVPEKFLDAVTGLSGAGPAYIYLAIEAMADGGVRMGLPRMLAQKLAAQTMMGAAKMVLETGKHPGLLKDEVCSPGGCTIQGVTALERGGIRAAFMNAVHDATVTSINTSGK